MTFFRNNKIRKERKTLNETIDRLDLKIQQLNASISYWKQQQNNTSSWQSCQDFYSLEIKGLLHQRKVLEMKKIATLQELADTF